MWQLVSYATAAAVMPSYLSALLFISTTYAHTYARVRVQLGVCVLPLTPTTRAAMPSVSHLCAVIVCNAVMPAAVAVVVATNAIIIAHLQRRMSAGVYLLICRSISAIGSIAPRNAVRMSVKVHETNERVPAPFSCPPY